VAHHRSSLGILVAAIGACHEPIPPAPDAGSDAGCAHDVVRVIDFLFVIDSTNDFSSEPPLLTAEFERMITVLASGDLDPRRDGDGDGVANQFADDFPGISSIQAGFVSMDMGSGGFDVPTCTDEPLFGDDGLLRSAGNTGRPECAASEPPIQQFLRGDVAELARQMRCVGEMQSDGCGLEQPLESMLKALTPSACGEPHCLFARGTRGHGDRENWGLVRSDSLLVVVVLTDEEDVSASDPALYDPDGTTYPGDLSVRHLLHPDALHPIERYVDGLLSLRRRPDRLLFAAIVGVPPSLTSETATLDEILAAPELAARVDPMVPTRPTVSCNLPGLGIAFAPRRIVEVAHGLEARGAHAFVDSLCREDYELPVSALLRRIGSISNAGVCP
jgi:hypothetical protein